MRKPEATPTRRAGRQGWGRWFVLASVIGSLALHGVAYGVLQTLPKPRIRRDADVTIYRRRRPKPRKPHRVRVVRKRPVVKPKPRPTAPMARPRLARRRVVRELRPRAPPPRASTRRPKAPPMTAPPPIDLTRSAGVNARLTASDGAVAFQTGTTALGDPKVPAKRPKPTRRPHSTTAPTPAGRRGSPRSVAVYVKRLPQMVSVPRLPYPAAARRRQIQGTVKLLVTISRKGRVIRVKVIRGVDRSLDRVAVRALKQSRFRPAMGTDGRPMVYTIRYRYSFRLES